MVLIGSLALGLAACAAPTANGGGPRPAVDSTPLLSTSYGPVRGQREDGVAIFKGVRYAASTEGYRFQPARAPQPWSAPVDALDYGNDCPQADGGDVPLFTSWANDRPRSEDCLFLNVWTRGLGDGGKRPIMVWLHGGGYLAGSGSSHGYDGVRLANRGDVVVVTINHRLNGFGHLYVAGLSGDAKYADSGNVGMLDIVRALEWVRDNAAAIGGDAGNVTIFGESGGAAKVSTLMGLTPAKGLFHRAIAQSGSMSLAGFEPPLATGIAKDILAASGQPTVEALAAMPMEDFIAAMRKSRTRGGLFQPVVDGRSLPRHAFTPDASPLSRNIPLLVGTNRTEMRLQAGLADPHNFDLSWEELPARLKPFLGGVDAAPIIAGMRQAFPASDASDIFFHVATHRNYRKTAITQAERKSQAGGAPVWMYRLDWATPVDGGKWQSPHALDIAFVFDNVAKSLSMTGSGPEQQKLADLMSDAWIAFARTGNPQTRALPQWPTYDPARRATMIFDVTPRIVDDPDGAERELLATLPEGRGR
ncbi:para-nitrobenzyl esterase [Sphingopyxis sp. JAI128]|nr:para-nitrobenzyl esterase [Sphingopyxis sp. JAI128]